MGENRVLKTFMFTDIVKSTDIRDAYIRGFGDKGNKIYDDEVIKPHDKILDRLITQFQGEVISTSGDSYFCAFDYARDAIQCAVASQRELIERKIPVPVSESNLPPYVQIRIGIHRGGASALLRAGQPNLSDHTINIAARIEGWANGEQVLMSEETWGNAGWLEGITQHEWKDYALKGVSGKWTLVEALWDEHQPQPPGVSPADLAFDIFAGRVAIITDELLSHPAGPKRVQQFYAGAKLDWDLIAAHGDIPRDQYEELLNQASQPSEGMRLICVVAEAGAGKSTLAWRIAAELHQRHGVLVIHIKDSSDAEVWYCLSEFHAKVNRPLYVLVDDIFHDPDAESAFHELNPWLPVTVLATSRRNEYRARRLKCETSQVNLKPPSRDEKRRILEKLSKSRSDLTAAQQRRLDAANQFLVLMMELTEGKDKDKDLGDIVCDTIKRLRDELRDEPAYRAYEHLCFAYQYSIAMPVSLLERLDMQGRFHNLPERDTTQGLIFWDSREGYVRVGHPIIAKTAAAFYAQDHSPQAVLTEITTMMNTSNALERHFFAYLLRALAQTKSPILTPLPEPLERAIVRCFQSVEYINELFIWRAFFHYRGQDEDAEKCIDMALTLEPVSSLDCNLLLNLCRGRGKEWDALPVIAKRISSHPESAEGRVPYLGLIELYAPNDVETVLQETSAWLAAHPSAKEVRRVYKRVTLSMTRSSSTAPSAKEVRRVYKQLITRYPRNPRVQFHYAAWLRDHGYDDEAEQRYRTLLAQARRWHQVYYGYGVLLLKLERFEEAAARFREALNIHTEHQMAHEGLAHALWKLGDFEQAEREFYSAIHWAGIHGQPQAKFYTGLGWFYLERERWQDALYALESARNEALDYFGNYWGIGKALIGMGEYAAAADALRTALEKEPNLQPPASEEIPQLLCECNQRLNTDQRDEQSSLV